VIDVNQCLDRNQPGDILSVLKASASNTQDIIPECADRYYDALVKAKRSKSENGKLSSLHRAN
jgi:Ras GTPase-activating-like protein IQGAP2/3